MPHIPRQSLAPSGLGSIDPASVPRAAKKTSSVKPVTPYLGESQGEPNAARSAKNANPLMTKLNMRTWDIDPVNVMKHLFQQEVKVDEHNGMVSRVQQ